MASTYSPNLALELIGTGDQAGTWGSTTNTNLGTLIEQAISGYVTQAVATGTDTTITIPNGATGVARNMYIELTGTGGASTNLIVPANKKLYFIYNNSTGAVTVKVSGQTGVSVPAAAKVILVSNGTDIVDAVTYLGTAITSANIATLTGTTLGYGSASITTASGVTLTYGSASITTLTGTTFGTTGATQVRGASGNILQLTTTSATITTIASTSATITGLSSTSANITTLTGTTVSYGSASITTVTGTTVGTTGTTQIRGASGNIAQFTATSMTVTTLTGTSSTITTIASTSATITGLSSTSANITTLTGTTVSYGSASITTVTGTTIGTAASATIRGVSGSIGQFTATSMTVTTLTGTSATITDFSTSSAVIAKFTAGSSSVSNLFASGTISDSAGNIRAIPSAGTAKTSAYTLTVADVGEFVELGTGGSVDVPNGIFTAGDAVTIFNNTTGSRPISLTITTAYIAGKDGDTATVSLATRGLATVLFINNSICVVSGNVS